MKAICVAAEVRYKQIKWIHWRRSEYIKQIFEVVPVVTEAAESWVANRLGIVASKYLHSEHLMEKHNSRQNCLSFLYLYQCQVFSSIAAPLSGEQNLRSNALYWTFCLKENFLIQWPSELLWFCKIICICHTPGRINWTTSLQLECWFFPWFCKVLS